MAKKNTKTNKKEKKQEKNMAEPQSKEETLGFHKGCLSVLYKEREEMQKIVSIVEQLIQMHLQALNEMGVNPMSEGTEDVMAEPIKSKKPIEDLL